MIASELATIIFSFCLGLHGKSNMGERTTCMESLLNCSVRSGGIIDEKRLEYTCKPKEIYRKKAD